MTPKIINDISAYDYIQSIINCFENGIVSVPLERGATNIDVSEYAGEFTEDDIFIIKTSGSTGKSKGVVLGKKALIANANALIKIHNLTEGDIHASCLPLNHVNALCFSVIATHIAKAKLKYFAGKDMTKYVQFIKKENVRTATIVPALIEALCESKEPLPDCLDYFITAAAPLSRTLAKKFYDIYGDRLVQGYGLSEGVNFSFTMPRLKGNEFVSCYIDNHPPVGLPLPNTEFILSKEGEVLIYSQSQFTRYQNNQKATDEAFEVIYNKRYLKTGDTGYMRDGYLVLNGRIKDIINKGGETIYPESIQQSWSEQQVKAIAFPVKSELFDNEIGMACNIENYKDCKPKPAAIYIGSKDFTETGKPQRLQMSKGFKSFNLSKKTYNSMLNSAVELASLLQYKKGKTERAKRIILSAQKVLEQYEIVGSEFYSEHIFDWVRENINDITEGVVTGTNYIVDNPKGWQSLMNNLMGIYPKAVFEVMQEMDIKGSILELGTGVGNLTKYLKKEYKVIESDLSISFMKNFQEVENGMRIDFDTEFDFPKNINAVVSCNALHCAKDKEKTIQYIFDNLEAGQHLIIGEGEKNPNQSIWAFDFIFQLFDGWFDNTGFLTERDWVELFYKVGFSQIRVNRIRSEKNILGYVICATK